MRNSEKKKILNEYKNLGSKLEIINKQIDNLRTRVMPSGLTIDDMPKGGIGYGLEEYVIDLEKLENKKKKLETKQKKAWKQVFDAAIKLEELESQIVIGRYLELKDWKRIANELGYSESHTLMLHRNALHNIFEKR